jgi:hypothetical protein
MRARQFQSVRLALVLVAVLGIVGPRVHAASSEPAHAKVPVAFVENRGQVDVRVRYYARGDRYAFYLTNDDIVMSFMDEQAAAGHTLALRFPGSSPEHTLVGASRASGEVNYFHGSDPTQWHTGIPRYAEIAYRQLWPGVDLQLQHGQSGTLKYELRVAAGASLAPVRFAYAGATRLSLDTDGALLIGTALGALRDSAPISYQIIDGVRVPVESRYELLDPRTQEFRIAIGAGYRPDHELIIDPSLQYSTLLGGSSDDIAGGIQVDAAGNAYIGGTTQSPDFPTTTGAFKRTGATSNFSDVFVTKLNASGSALIYSTFVGGSNFDWGRAIALDAAGNVYITGQTKSSNFPTTGGAFDRTFNVDTCPRCGIDQYDAFVTKLNASGSALVYSTFLGGFDLVDGLGFAVDGSGNAYVVGETGSANFPITANAFQRTRGAAYDAFVTKLNATGSALVYSTYLGGGAVEFATHVAVDAGGNAYVIGSTTSADFPTTGGSFSPTSNGSWDAFVTKLNPAGSALVYSTYLGGTGTDSGAGIAVDGTGSAVVCGGSGSDNFPTTPGAFNPVGRNGSGFVTRLSADGSSLVYSTMLGGTTGFDGAAALVLDPAGNVWLTGSANSVDFPATPDAFQFNIAGGTIDAFVAELSANGSTLLYSTYLGGTQSEGGASIARDSQGSIYIAGHTYSADFPTTAGAFDRTFSGDLNVFWGDAFVAKFTTSGTGGGTNPPPPPPPPPQTASLTVTVSGRSGQTVTSSPAGISVNTNSSGSSDFAVGSSVTLTVATGRDAIWSGACSSGGSKRRSCTFTVNATASVTANVQ